MATETVAGGVAEFQIRNIEEKLEVIAAAVQLLLRKEELHESNEFKQLVEEFGEFSSTTYIGSNE